MAKRRRGGRDMIPAPPVTAVPAETDEAGERVAEPTAPLAEEPILEARGEQIQKETTVPTSKQEEFREESKVTPAYGNRTQTQMEGVAVVGEAVRRVMPESAEFLIEISASAPTAAQALRDHNTKTAQVVQTAGAAGVQRTDIQSISVNLFNLYSPAMPMPMLPAYGGMSQSGPALMPSYGGALAVQPELQFGSYQLRSVLRVIVRELARVGEAVDAVTRSGAILLGNFSFRVSDEPAARKAALEAAGRDARSKAETLAAAAGRQVGEAVAVAEELIATNGMYAAVRSAVPMAFGDGAPRMVGELEYYARVAASFRFQ